MRKRFLVALVLLSGCFDDPTDAKTWIKKLDDVRDQKEAVRQLVKLKDKKAVEPLIALYKKSHDPEHLRALASFDDPASVPTLVDSLDYSEESFDNASIAATALGDIGDKSAVDALSKAVTKPLPVKSRANVVKVEAMKALLKIKDPKSVDALIKVLSTSADEQDFYLNKLAAEALGVIGDPRAVPALVRGLFMTGRGADIFQTCRISLLQIGGDAPVDKLIETMQRKNADVELDAKRYEFFPGVVVQKTGFVLGDLRSKRAVPALLEELARKDEGLAAPPGKGVPAHQGTTYALGSIGDPSAVKPLAQVMLDGKRPTKERAAAAQALNLVGDTSALPALAQATKLKWLSGTTIDPEAGAVVADAITAYSRLADGPGASGLALPKVDPEIADMAETVKNAQERLAVAKECNRDAACYAKYLEDVDVNKAEKAATMLGRLGKGSLPALAKHVGDTAGNGLVRMTVLYAMAHAADAKSCDECKKALDTQIAKDEGKKNLIPLVDEMKATRAMISH